MEVIKRKSSLNVFYGLKDPSLNEMKEDKLGALNNYLNVLYREYINAYPEVEVKTFDQKAIEAFKVINDEEVELSATPILSLLCGNDKQSRNALAKSVYEKLGFTTKLETWGVLKRDAIKAAATKEELNAISIDINVKEETTKENTEESSEEQSVGEENVSN
ncbi:hypothetical protein CFT13S00388_02540 [Campylobacter fetus subsp. testudinum]|uniref:hypothetical protein n=1 Tax=Campylobacter fetus TaxID=196 RepID=UPI000818ABE5|nr:hypothetical protein [Campylobacter fetus]OCR88064.1 hypothetical protein CFT13S00388_02540 [Campylobacter fetus subsp. testudinum]